MSRVITQTGEVKEEVTVTLMQGKGMSYSVTFNPGAQITLIVVSHDQPKRIEPFADPNQKAPF